MAVVLQEVAAQGRRTRRPSVQFYVTGRPYEVIPFLLAPVLPGETLSDGQLQARVVTDPVKNKLTGWWHEYYFFYVRLRDLPTPTDFEEMMLDPDKSMAARYTAADAAYYHTGGINYRKLCLEKIMEHYFRADDEALAQGGAGWTYPVASIDRSDVLDSAIRDADFVVPADEEIVVGADDKITTSEIDIAMRKWEFARANRLTDMDFDDYLATFGIRVAPEVSDKPELLRYLREWQYPSNTINPTNGSPSSAVSWSIRDRISKDRFFKEPGFIVGLTLSRPKIYLGNQTGSFTSLMADAYSWLPAIMSDDPYSSLRKFAKATNSPLAGPQADDYWVDIKDLFLYGEQFFNDAEKPSVALPTAALQKRYPVLTDSQGLFVDSAGGGTLQKVRQDGIIDLSIKGRLTDTTPPVSRLAV